MPRRSGFPLLPSQKSLVFLSLSLFLVFAAALWGPIAQDPAYHDFADHRAFLGVPNFLNVVSNVPFALVGIAGLFLLLSDRARGIVPELFPAYVAFFAGAVLIAAGSAWYHAAPANATLVWDRLPMTLSFVAIFVVVLGERASVALARRLFVPLLLFGAASVLYWVVSARLGREDLRPYLLVQALGIVLTPLLLVLYPSRFTRDGLLWGLLACYAATMLAEVFDRAVYGALGFVSGHTLKHLFAASGMAFVAGAVRVRRPAGAPAS